MQKCRKHLFLDLEDTIITPVLDGWWNTELMNVDKIRNVIEDFQPDFVNIFSFALHGDLDRNNFDASGCRSMIEKAIGMPLSHIPIVENEIIQMCCNTKWISSDRVDFLDIRDFWGKHDGFRLSMQHLFQHTWKNHGNEVEVILLDDDVINENFEWPDLHVKGRIINIDTI
jgi:hypothetical protein